MNAKCSSILSLPSIDILSLIPSNMLSESVLSSSKNMKPLESSSIVERPTVRDVRVDDADERTDFSLCSLCLLICCSNNCFRSSTRFSMKIFLSIMEKELLSSSTLFFFMVVSNSFSFPDNIASNVVID